ncbi:glycosyltransferase family 4 protein [Nocardioides ginsengisegetis]
MRNPAHVRAQYRFGPETSRLRSIARDRAISRLRIAPHVLHVRNVYRPSRCPYTAFIDSTTAQKASEWTDWPGHATDVSRRIELERAYYASASVVLTAGHDAAESLHSDYGLGRDQVEVVGAGLSGLPDLHPRITRPGLRILFVGREFDRKGGPPLLEAIGRLRGRNVDVRLDVVGPAKDEVLSRSGVVNHGWVSDSKRLFRLYSEADVFCLPALHEPYGRVVLEAMSYGIPCLVSTTGELPRLVEHGVRGLQVSPGSADELERSLEWLTDHPDDRAAMGRAARAYVEDFTWDAVARRILEAWDRRGIRDGSDAPPRTAHMGPKRRTL